MAPPRRAPNLRLRALLAEAGWSQDVLARKVNSLAALRGLRTRYDRTSVAHWLTGSLPRPPVPELIREAFSERLGRTVTALDTGMPEAGGLSEFWAVPTLGDPVARLAMMAAAELDPVHRAEARALGYNAGAVLPPGPREDPGKVVAEGPPTLPAHAIRQLARLYVFHIEAFGGGHASSGLAAHLAGSVPQWLRWGGSDRRVLFRGAAQLTHLLALSVADMGAEGQAQGYHLAAARLAVEVEDRAMYALSVRALSTQALRTGRVELAERLARSAFAAAPPDASPALHAYLEAQLAVTHARTRRRETALTALAAAEQSIGRAEDADGKGPFDRYPLADFSYQQAMALSALGERRPALRALHTSLRHRGPTRPRSRALTRARIAEVYLAQGDLETAGAHWYTVVEEAARLDSQQVQSRLAHMRRELHPYRRSRIVSALLARDAELAATRTEPRG
ncbi:hypothetical protein [Streptomyces sp. NPDC057623]|uniref:hypothetical protein n=1 Tax=Streptomyces sp. NPDC057623 TaxID=3346187 RepID=UPI003679A01A